jgi:hypothetical protein
MQETYNISFIQNNHLTNEGISLYADGIALERTDLLPEEMLDHVANCEFCRNEVFATHEIIKDQYYFGDIGKHPFFSKKLEIVKTKSVFFRLWIPVAASILVLFGFFYLIYLKPGNKSENIVKNTTESKTEINNNPGENRIVEKDSVENISNIPEENKLIAQNAEYKTNDLFESLMESELRGDGFEIVAPVNNMQFNKNQKVEFKWNNPNDYILNIIVYNNTSKKVFEASQIKGEAYKINAPFSPGLYYWKIIQNDELLKIGKFIVK